MPAYAMRAPKPPRSLSEGKRRWSIGEWNRFASHSSGRARAVTIVHHEHTTDKATELDWEWLQWQKDLDLSMKNVAGLYYRYAEWVKSRRQDVVSEEQQWPRLGDRVALMTEFDRLREHIDSVW